MSSTVMVPTVLAGVKYTPDLAGHRHTETYLARFDTGCLNDSSSFIKQGPLAI